MPWEVTQPIEVVVVEVAAEVTVEIVAIAQEEVIRVAEAITVAVQVFQNHFEKTHPKEFAGTTARLDPKQPTVAVTRIHQKPVFFQWMPVRCS